MPLDLRSHSIKPMKALTNISRQKISKETWYNPE